METDYNPGDSLFGMATGAEIRAAREARGMSQADLASAVGVSQPAIRKIEGGQTLRSKYLADIERFLGLAHEPIGRAEPGNFRRPPELLGERDLPVFAAAEGGEGALVVSTEPIDWVLRPWFLSHVRDAYGVVVTGESMVPVYRPGDLLLVNPRLPPIREKNAIFVSGEEHGEFRATVKEYRSSDKDDWLVRQYNPPKDFSLPKKDWSRALRIVGRYEGG